MWTEWCRDPLLALGCSDPVERIEKVKAGDPRRQQIIELFKTWSECHGSDAMTVADLDERVKKIADPHQRGRQFLAKFFGGLSGTRAAGFVLTRQAAAGKWGASTYALHKA
jgi:hypothetical protein